jgi:hypothetical protein
MKQVPKVSLQRVVSDKFLGLLTVQHDYNFNGDFVLSNPQVLIDQ